MAASTCSKSGCLYSSSFPLVGLPQGPLRCLLYGSIVILIGQWFISKYEGLLPTPNFGGESADVRWSITLHYNWKYVGWLPQNTKNTAESRAIVVRCTTWFLAFGHKFCTMPTCSCVRIADDTMPTCSCVRIWQTIQCLHVLATEVDLNLITNHAGWINVHIFFLANMC